MKESHELNEMSFYRGDVIDKCLSLGKLFIEHFDVVFKEGVNSDNFHHHCAEMQAWWNDVKHLRLKPKNRNITEQQLIDWFFTVGSSIDTFLEKESAVVYDKFIIELLSTNNSVEDCILRVLSLDLNESYKPMTDDDADLLAQYGIVFVRNFSRALDEASENGSKYLTYIDKMQQCWDVVKDMRHSNEDFSNIFFYNEEVYGGSIEQSAFSYVMIQLLYNKNVTVRSCMYNALAKYDYSLNYERTKYLKRS